MDDITQGQWRKNHHNDNDENHIHNDDMLDSYTMQKSFRKMATSYQEDFRITITAPEHNKDNTMLLDWIIAIVTSGD
jgi:hypothetical protein